MVHMKALSALFKCSDPKIWIYMYLRTLRPAPLLHPRAQPRAWRPRSRFRGTWHHHFGPSPALFD
jgi:hypothetical protein